MGSLRDPIGRPDRVRFGTRSGDPIGFVSASRWGRRLGSLRARSTDDDPHPNPLPEGEGVRTGRFALLIALLAGCGPSADSPLVIASTWSATERTQFEAEARQTANGLPPIVWVVLEPGERWESVVDRRGGVDLLLGGPATAYARLARAGRLVPADPARPIRWRLIRRPGVGEKSSTTGDPRVDPALLASLKARLQAGSWPEGYEAIIRASLEGRPLAGSAESWSECLAVVEGGPNRARAAGLIDALEARGFVQLADSSSVIQANADELLVDLLGAALVDAEDELREADAALGRFGHPTQAEAAIGQRPPWPPASLARLQADPNGPAMVETLLEQIAPDPESRRWLETSWSGPKRTVDGTLLAEIAGAASGKLALEPRFRAWLRGEWTAWTRQLYRRVARVAGGYVPS